MPEVKRMEYRVVGESADGRLSLLTEVGDRPNVADMERDAYLPSPDYSDVRIQKRTVTESPWKDVTDE
jgi:hypothetical protein